MIEFNNIPIAYANKINRNGCVLSEEALKSCIKSTYVPIFENYNFQKLIGVTTNIKVDNDKLVIDGYLLKKQSLRDKLFRFGILGDRSLESENEYTLKNCSLICVGLIDKNLDSYR